MLCLYLWVQQQEIILPNHCIVHFYVFDQKCGAGVRAAGDGVFIGDGAFLTLGSEPDPEPPKIQTALEPEPLEPAHSARSRSRSCF